MMMTRMIAATAINTRSQLLVRKRLQIVGIGRYTRNSLSSVSLSSSCYNINSSSSSSSSVSFVSYPTSSFYSKQRRRENDEEQQENGRITMSSTLIHPSQAHLQFQQLRRYHTTQHNPMVLYGTIILVSTLCYVGYKKYHGEPLKPHSATAAQDSYRKLEQDRLERDKKYTAAAAVAGSSSASSSLSSSYSTKVVSSGEQQPQPPQQSDTPRHVDEKKSTTKK